MKRVMNSDQKTVTRVLILSLVVGVVSFLGYFLAADFSLVNFARALVLGVLIAFAFDLVVFMLITNKDGSLNFHFRN